MTIRASTGDAVVFSPRLPLGSDSFNAFMVFAVELSNSDPRDADRLRDRRLSEISPSAPDGQILRVCVSVLSDLRAQDWQLFISEDGIISVAQPGSESIAPAAQKERVRRGHLRERDAQLTQPAVRQFIAEMERPRLRRGGWVSIFSLMRDGRELAERLREAARLQGDGRIRSLRAALDPYLQPVTPNAVCDYTGLLLSDIWRYFRHTWTNHYSSTPGRQVAFLVRDAAAANHPVIGIGAYGSAVVQLAVRDEWIGWSPGVFLARVATEPLRFGKWLLKSLDDLIGAVYIDDFIKAGTLTRGALRNPNQNVVRRLLRVCEEAAKEHRNDPQASEHKASTLSGDNWKAEARTPLFRSKRAKALARLLSARAVFNDLGLSAKSPNVSPALLRDQRARQSIKIILRHAKASRVGVDMLDITVCGAVAPYGPILGGKLVALLLASPTAAAEYERRYRRAVSLIASSMAGRPVIRPPKLVLLGTTSLYGSSSSQYNRLRVPSQTLGGEPNAILEYKELGRSTGFGSFHFSAVTANEIEILLSQHQRGRPVNSIFGEGVNPKLRKLRSGLEMAGLPADVLLRHGDSRLVYGVALATNFRDLLLGLTKKRVPIVPASRSAAASTALIGYWIDRWLAGRIERPGVIEGVERHTLVHPIRHGARVELPEGYEIPRPQPLIEAD